jgi:hypothetical protein
LKGYVTGGLPGIGTVGVSPACEKYQIGTKLESWRSGCFAALQMQHGKAPSRPAQALGKLKRNEDDRKSMSSSLGHSEQ